MAGRRLAATVCNADASVYIQTSFQNISPLQHKEPIALTAATISGHLSVFKAYVANNMKLLKQKVMLKVLETKFRRTYGV